jgi:hypothetical protein
VDHPKLESAGWKCAGRRDQNDPAQPEAGLAHIAGKSWGTKRYLDMSRLRDLAVTTTATQTA